MGWHRYSDSQMQCDSTIQWNKQQPKPTKNRHIVDNFDIARTDCTDIYLYYCIVKSWSGGVLIVTKCLIFQK